MKLSIIIPVYNSERFLAKCLESVCIQDLPNSEYEIIIINDGSSDGSAKIIEDFQGKYSNVIGIKQENKGVSAARNAGLEIGKGAFVTFVDSDDRITVNSLQDILAYIDQYDLDILYTEIETIDEAGKHISYFPATGKQNEIKDGFSHPRRTYTPTFYRRNLLQDIRFNKSIAIGEDTVFNAKVQAFAKRVSQIDIPYYKYMVRENSLTKQGHSSKAFHGFVKAIEDIRNFQHENFNENPEAQPFFDQVYETFVTRIIELNIIPTWNKFHYLELVELLNKECLSYILDLFSIKYPYVNKSYFQFMHYQKYLNLKSRIYNLIHRA